MTINLNPTFTLDTVSLLPVFEIPDSEFSVEFGKVYTTTTGITPYTGATEITPTESTKTLATAGKIVTENIIINPIPTNYGKITWDGTKITVS